MKDLKPGDLVAYKNVGYGLISYEGPDTVVEIRDGKLFTETFDSMGMEWKAGQWIFDTGLGLKTIAVDPEDPIVRAGISQ